MTKARDLANSAAAFSAVSATELGYVDGVTSAIQTQLDAKVAKTLTSTTGDIIYASAANTPARLGIGSSAQVLTVASGLPSWATPAGGGGKVLQVINATYNTQTGTTSTSLVTSGFAASITPTLNTSKILVLVDISDVLSYAQNARVQLNLYRGGSSVLQFTDAGGSHNYTGNVNVGSATASYLDAPATTSSTTYTVYFKSVGGEQVYVHSGYSTMTLLEIGA
jgi:hypothetical protein